MYKSLAAAVALSTAAMAPTVAFADDAPKSDITITGNADITTQYRLRGISQTDNDAAIQGGITVSHASGFYLSTWASNLGGYGTFGGSNMELDLIGGYTSGVTLAQLPHISAAKTIYLGVGAASPSISFP